MSNQELPAIGAIVTFTAPQDGLPFTGRVIKSYGFAVAVASLDGSLPIQPLTQGEPYVLVSA